MGAECKVTPRLLLFWAGGAVRDVAGARTRGDGARKMSMGAAERDTGAGSDKASGMGPSIECDSVLDEAADAPPIAAALSERAALTFSSGGAKEAAAEEATGADAEAIATAAAFGGSRRSRAKNSATPISASSNVGGRVTLRRTHLGRCAAAAGAANRSSSRMTAP